LKNGAGRPPKLSSRWSLVHRAKELLTRCGTGPGFCMPFRSGSGEGQFPLGNPSSEKPPAPSAAPTR